MEPGIFADEEKSKLCLLNLCILSVHYMHMTSIRVSIYSTQPTHPPLAEISVCTATATAASRARRLSVPIDPPPRLSLPHSPRK